MQKIAQKVLFDFWRIRASKSSTTYYSKRDKLKQAVKKTATSASLKASHKDDVEHATENCLFPPSCSPH